MKYKLSPIQSWYSKRLIHSFALRDYQQEAIDSILEASESGVKRQAIEMATGSGKTVVFSHLIPLLKGKEQNSSFRTYTRIDSQSYDKITRINPDLRVGIEMAESRARLNDDVIVASVQSLATNKDLQNLTLMISKPLLSMNAIMQLHQRIKNFETFQG